MNFEYLRRQESNAHSQITPTYVNKHTNQYPPAQSAGIAIGSRVCVCDKYRGDGYVVGPGMAIAICVFP